MQRHLKIEPVSPGHSLSAHLREQTTTAHKQLESTSMLHDLVEPTLQLPNYRQIIERKWRAYHQWQQQLDEIFMAIELAPQWRINLHVEALSRELTADLQLNDDRTLPEPLEISGMADYLGHAYVFQGASLGASFILRALCSNQNLQVEGFYFFNVLSEDLLKGQSWVSWKQQLDALALEHSLNPADVGAAANRCFAHIQRWFQCPARCN